MSATATAAVLAFPAQTHAPKADEPRPAVHYIGAAAIRIDLARADVHRAQPDRLYTASAADLVQIVEALRGSLHDILQMTMAPSSEWTVLERAEDANLATLRPASLIRLASDLSADLSARTA